MKVKLNKNSIVMILITGLILSLYWNYAKGTDKASATNNTVVLEIGPQKMAGIQVTTLEPTVLTNLISAPGEVIPNESLTSKVTTRVPAQVIQRYVQDGQHVKAGQPLVELSSVELAKTQGDLLLATQDWERVKNLGKDAISAKRYSEAQVAYQHAFSTALAYGMTESEINELLNSQKPSEANGQFKLFAPRDGVILNIHFVEGELIEPGRVLLQVVEERTVWVDAKLSPDLVRQVKIGEVARVTVNNTTFTGHVIQVLHQLDEITRTRTIRLEVPNSGDLLHSGQFVNCQIEAGHTLPLLAVPVDAVLRTTEGDWAVYIEKQPKHFQQMKVKVVSVINNQAIIQGVLAGTRIITKGAFFVHAELNKSDPG